MKKFFIIAVILISSVYAQQQKSILTGNLEADSKYISSENKGNNFLSSIKLQPNGEGEKSPFLAGLFSVILPGAGEFYTENYLKTGIFLAVEAAVITTAILYNKKGDDRTNEFQNYADQNWSVVKYAQWLVSQRSDLSPEDQDKLYHQIVTNDNTNLPPWERVNWTQLNAAETGSHRLPYHGEQQYYELIGKYHEYSPGWDDYTGGSDVKEVSPHFLYYADQRGKANDFYNIASTAVIGIYVNHILSALDAVWSASRFNNNLALSTRVQRFDFADRSILIPTLNFKYNF